MNHQDVDRAIEYEIERGGQLIESNIDAIRHVNHVVKKFKIYRNSKKFLKIKFDDYDSDYSDEINDDEVEREKAVPCNINEKSTYTINLMATNRTEDDNAERKPVNFVPSLIPSSVLMENAIKI